MPTQLARTFSLDGTFTLEDIEHVISQIRNLPNDKEAVIKAAGYPNGYDYHANRLYDAARHFQGKLTLTLVELPHPGIPAKAPDPVEDDDN